MLSWALFGLSALLSLLSSAVAAKLLVWPWLRTMTRDRALLMLVAPQMFVRFIGLSFLVPGVVSPSLPAAFAMPAAYGDLGAGILAIIAVILLTRRAAWAVPAVWLFNIWGAFDLLFAFFQGGHAGIEPGDLGAAFFIPTAIVPPVLVSHLLVFILLVRGQSTVSPPERGLSR